MTPVRYVASPSATGQVAINAVATELMAQDSRVVDQYSNPNRVRSCGAHRHFSVADRRALGNMLFTPTKATWERQSQTLAFS
jgi:hypothetical protein